jgi:hypothetical protein
MYIAKAAETTFVQKMGAKNVDEIDTLLLKQKISRIRRFIWGV